MRAIFTASTGLLAQKPCPLCRLDDYPESRRCVRSCASAPPPQKHCRWLPTPACPLSWCDAAPIVPVASTRPASKCLPPAHWPDQFLHDRPGKTVRVHIQSNDSTFSFADVNTPWLVVMLLYLDARRGRLLTNSRYTQTSGAEFRFGKVDSLREGSSVRLIQPSIGEVPTASLESCRFVSRWSSLQVPSPYQSARSRLASSPQNHIPSANGLQLYDFTFSARIKLPLIFSSAAEKAVAHLVLVRPQQRTTNDLLENIWRSLAQPVR